MCGIAGIFALTETGKSLLSRIEACNQSLHHRGPDFQRSLVLPRISMAHSRLSIIDTSNESHQPFSDEKGEYFMVFNGEIFNYQELRKELTNHGIKFQTNGDAEVLLELFKREGVSGLNKISGFFAAGFYHKTSNTLTLIRDRFGVKPLYYYKSQDHFIFASETRAIKESGVPLSISKESLYYYFHLNYIPGNLSIFEEVKKIPPGSSLEIRNGHFKSEHYYSLKEKADESPHKSVHEIESKLRELIRQSVQDRLVADIPIGCFLSGGIDSSIVTGLASQQKKNISTFSLGFKNNEWFDESKEAEFTARLFGTNHYTFLLNHADLLDEFDNFLNAMDEPFADSSALNVFILSKRTKSHVKAVLSGDGADEIFGGYNKHRAEWMIRNNWTTRMLARTGRLIAPLLHSSRNSSIGNKIRQWQKLSSLADDSAEVRYWKMACIADTQQVNSLFKKDFFSENYSATQSNLLQHIQSENSLNGFLRNDISLVLESDMLVKTDRMSMANGLEIRSPFLDYRVVEYGLNVPEKYKVSSKEGKIILKSAFRDLLPAAILERKKRGFEIPLQRWLKEDLNKMIQVKLLHPDFIFSQGIFNLEAIHQLKTKAFSANPGDSVARLWAIILFNFWYQKNQLNFS